MRREVDREVCPLCPHCGTNVCGQVIDGEMRCSFTNRRMGSRYLDRLRKHKTSPADALLAQREADSTEGDNDEQAE
jgi:hypothetical protein